MKSNGNIGVDLTACSEIGIRCAVKHRLYLMLTDATGITAIKINGLCESDVRSITLGKSGGTCYSCVSLNNQEAQQQQQQQKVTSMLHTAFLYVRLTISVPSVAE